METVLLDLLVGMNLHLVFSALGNFMPQVLLSAAAARPDFFQYE